MYRAEFEIHFLIRLPEHIKRLEEKISLMYEVIGPPIQRGNEIGIYRAVGTTVEQKATGIADARTALEKRIKRSIERGQKLVEIINSLPEEDKQKLIDYYTKGKESNVQAVFVKIEQALCRQDKAKEVITNV